MYVCVVVCLGWGWEGVIVSYKLTQKHVSPYRMVSVYVRVGSFRMQINDRLHDINNMGQPKPSEVCGALGVSHTAG